MSFFGNFVCNDQYNTFECKPSVSQTVHTRACSRFACLALRVSSRACMSVACWRSASLGLRLRIADSETEIWFASSEFALAAAQDASLVFCVALYNANRTYSDLVWSTAKPKFVFVPNQEPKVGLDLETALAKSIPNSAALGMKLQNSKCISMPKIVVFGNEFRFCKIQICAQNLGVELVLVFLHFCKFLVGKFLFESF